MRKFLSPVLHWDWGLSSWQVSPRNCEVSSCWRNRLANCIRHTETPATDKQTDGSAQKPRNFSCNETRRYSDEILSFWRRWWTVTFSTFDINPGVGCKTPSVWVIITWSSGMSHRKVWYIQAKLQRNLRLSKTDAVSSSEAFVTTYQYQRCHISGDNGYKNASLWKAVLRKEKRHVPVKSVNQGRKLTTKQ